MRRFALFAVLAMQLSVTACGDSAPATASESSSESRASQPEQSLADKLVREALPWENREYRLGKAEQCMNWTREVLVAACGGHFASLETKTPWDQHLLGPGDELLPEHVDSLAGDEFGEKVHTVAALIPGDLVFLKNTYGDWADGVLTHVGIALGDGRYIHRMTSNEGLVKINKIPVEDFDSGIRLKDALCQTP
ncbi:hypothetical protein ACNKU7_03655 [Microbulbifer sp. SA54]|uniref:hypothetical protein n=1 Tax=Microbulbifer sp. SA54 TaxID=3401577 RepID=UPI003AAB5A02